MNKKKYCIITDLDGTFFGKDSLPPKSNTEAVDKFQSLGHYFTFATGRHIIIGKQDFFPCLNTANAPIGLCNGAIYADIKQGKILFDEVYEDNPNISYEEIYSLLKTLKAENPKVHIRYTARNGVHYLFENEKEEISQWYKVVFESGSKSENDTLYRRADLDCIAKRFEKRFGDTFVYSFSSPALFEVINPHCTKACYVKRLKEYFSHAGEDITTIACGDYENDIEMLGAADVAVCPSNAIPKVLEMVKEREKNGSGFISCDNNEGAIALLIKKLINGELSF